MMYCTKNIFAILAVLFGIIDITFVMGSDYNTLLAVTYGILSVSLYVLYASIVKSFELIVYTVVYTILLFVVLSIAPLIYIGDFFSILDVDEYSYFRSEIKELLRFKSGWFFLLFLEVMVFETAFQVNKTENYQKHISIIFSFSVVISFLMILFYLFRIPSVWTYSIMFAYMLLFPLFLFNQILKRRDNPYWISLITAASLTAFVSFLMLVFFFFEEVRVLDKASIDVDDYTIEVLRDIGFVFDESVFILIAAHLAFANFCLWKFKLPKPEGESAVRS